MFGLTDKTSKSETNADSERDYLEAQKSFESAMSALNVVEGINKALEAPKPTSLDNITMISSSTKGGVELTLYFYKGGSTIIYAEKGGLE